jgi:hypothetical protein
MNDINNLTKLTKQQYDMNKRHEKLLLDYTTALRAMHEEAAAIESTPGMWGVADDVRDSDVEFMLQVQKLCPDWFEDGVGMVV